MKTAGKSQKRMEKAATGHPFHPDANVRCTLASGAIAKTITKKLAWSK